MLRSNCCPVFRLSSLKLKFSIFSVSFQRYRPRSICYPPLIRCRLSDYWHLIKIFRMRIHSVQKPYRGLIRLCLADETWLSQSKHFWLTEMENARNTKTLVRIHYRQQEVELELERNLNGLMYAASTRIRINNFVNFCRIFEQN